MQTARPTINLRAATPDDVALLRHWDGQPHVVASNPNDDWGWEVELARAPDWREQLIAELGGRPIGFIQIIDPRREDSHYWGDVPPNLRAVDIWIGEAADLGKGYGTWMMELALARCFADRAVSAVLIDPLASNTRAHRFYERFGFRLMERRRFGEDDCFVYRLDREDYETGLTRALIRSAVRAPSSHNTQPWLFRLSASAIDLFADRTRALPVNDPHDRELTISCGCALTNLRVAGASRGLHLKVEFMPDATDPDWLARASIGRDSGDAALGELREFVERRRTYRRRFAAREVEPSALDALIEAASVEGAWLRSLASEEARHQAARLVAEGDAAQWADPRWRRELAAWMHPRRRGDGLAVPTLAAPVAQLVVRTFDMGGGVGAKDRELAEASPLLAALCTEGDEVRDWLRAGQALQRVLLVACRHGLQASYLNQPIQVTDLRPQLGGLVGGGFPQILLRLGYPTEEVRVSPRRGIDDVIESPSAPGAEPAAR